MSYAKRSWEIARAVTVSQSEFKKVEENIFTDFEKECKDDIEHTLALGYALHYATDEDDANSDMYAKRILDSVGAERTQWSKDLDNSTTSLRIKDVKAELDKKLELIEKGDIDIKSIKGEVLQAIADAKENKQQSLILRSFELLTNHMKLEVQGLEL